MPNKIDSDIASVVDLLAHEYGWSIEYAQELGVDEITLLREAIERRHQYQWKTMCYVINCALNAKLPKFDASDNEVDDSVYESTDRTRTEDQFRSMIEHYGGVIKETRDGITT